jgi:hypothetical protein
MHFANIFLDPVERDGVKIRRKSIAKSGIKVDLNSMPSTACLNESNALNVSK